MTSLLLKLSSFTGVGFGGWVLGRYSERISNEDTDNTTSILSHLKNMPCLPVFGTVSATSAIVPADNTNNHMGQKLSGDTLRASEFMRFGFPGADNVKVYDDYVLSYDKRNRVAHWVFEHLSKEKLPHKAKGIDRSKCEFKPDKSIHPYFRSENMDYKGSGYDRGHLAAAGNHRLEQKHVDQTFYLCNMAPQVGRGFNRGAWNKLEKYVRRLTDYYKNVYVCTGPLYLPRLGGDGKKYVKYEVIGANHVAVPTHFYKVIVGEKQDSKLEMEAYILPNKPIDDKVKLENFQVPPETIERAAGLLFFDKISRSKLTMINGKKNQ